MKRSRTTIAGPAAGLLLLVAIVAAACGTGAAPSAPASPSPSAPASEAPSEAPTEHPSQAPSDAPSGGAIDLDTADESDVSVVIADPKGVLSGARSGRAGEGMSVRWGDVQVENVDEDSLRVTWVGLPVDAEVALEVAADGDGYVLAFTQPAPPENSDAMGFDRVLVLDFAAPVRAQDVQATFATA